MTKSAEEVINESLNRKFKSLIDNWTNIKDKDKTEILSYLESPAKKEAGRPEEVNAQKIESAFKQNPKTHEVTVDLKKLKEVMQITPELRTSLASILREKEQNAAREYQRHFSNIQFDASQEKGSIHRFERGDKSQDPKQELLTGVTAALKEAQKIVDQNSSIGVKAGIKKRELMLGKKAQKILSAVTNLKDNQTRKEGLQTKTLLSHKSIMHIAENKQKVKLLNDIQKYLQQDKSEPFDLKKFNDSVGTLYNYHRNEMTLLRNPQATKEVSKKHKTELANKYGSMSINEIAEELAKRMAEAKESKQEAQRKHSITTEVEPIHEAANSVKAPVNYTNPRMKLDQLQGQQQQMEQAQPELVAAREKVLSSGLTQKKKETILSKAIRAVSPRYERGGGWGGR